MTHRGTVTQYLFRRATPADSPAIHRLRGQFVEELNAPKGALEADFSRSELMLVEALEGTTRQAVGMIGLVHASSEPFIFERLIPDVWQRLDLPTLTGCFDLRREDLVELDWGYVEKPYRGKQLALLLLAGCLLHAHRRGYPVSVGIANTALMARLPGGIFRGTGLMSQVAGVPYELGALWPGQSAAVMADVVQAACTLDSKRAWHLDVS